MKSITFTVLILCSVLSLLLCSCVRNTPPPDDIYSDGYTNSSVEQYRPLNSKANMTERDAVNTALSNNPGYKIKQLQAVSAEAGYYSSLINLTPNVSSNNIGVTTTYQVNPSSIINVLTAKANANKALYDTDNYRREMVKDINLITYNDMQESKSIAAIQKENEGCQRKMANNILEKKKSTADILIFKINELRAKAAAIEAEKSYKTNSYALATNMGMTSAALPADITQKSVPAKSFENDKNRQLGLNYYLDMAIKNRPDLKALKEALSAAKYDLYSATGALTPIVNSAAGNSNSSVYASENINLGSNIAEIRSKDADYAVQQEDLQKKWISVVKEVKETYLKLTLQLTVRKTLESTMQMAKLRCDLVAKQYSTGKTKGITTLNQAQKDLVNAQKSFIKAVKDLSDAKYELYAACGIPNERTKKPSITTLNQAQHDYVDAEKNYVGNRIEILKAETSLNAVTGIQR